jgi:hypothetical protein
MIAFFAKDIEWIFSGIGVAAIVLVVRFIIWLIKPMTELSPNSRQTDRLSSEITKLPQTQENTYRPASRSQPIKRRGQSRRKQANTYRTTSSSRSELSASTSAYIDTHLTPQSITKSIRNAPLLQQSDITKAYKERVVIWKGRIQSADLLTDGKVAGTILCGDIGVSFEAGSQEQYKLTSLKMGHKIQVTGKINEAGPYHIFLKDVSITILY